MELTINGERQQVEPVHTVAELLEWFRVTHQAVAVMANGMIIAQDQFAVHPIEAGDTIEIIRFVGGG